MHSIYLYQLKYPLGEKEANYSSDDNHVSETFEGEGIGAQSVCQECSAETANPLDDSILAIQRLLGSCTAGLFPSRQIVTVSACYAVLESSNDQLVCW